MTQKEIEAISERMMDKFEIDFPYRGGTYDDWAAVMKIHSIQGQYEPDTDALARVLSAETALKEAGELKLAEQVNERRVEMLCNSIAEPLAAAILKNPPLGAFFEEDGS